MKSIYTKKERAKIYLKASKVNNTQYGACEKISTILKKLDKDKIFTYSWNYLDFVNKHDFPELYLFKRNNNKIYWLNDNKGDLSRKQEIYLRIVVLQLCYEMCKD